VAGPSSRTRCTTKAVRKSLGTTLSARVADTTHAAAERLDAIGDGLPTLRLLHHSALDIGIRPRGGPVALAEGIVPGGQLLAPIHTSQREPTRRAQQELWRLATAREVMDNMTRVNADALHNLTQRIQ
jgi:hypothetical protein